MQWSSSLSICSATFDRAHRRCMAAQAQLETATDRQYQLHLRALIDTLQAAFAEEEHLMESIGFPELIAHRTQHKRVLKALQDVESHAARSNFAAARELVALLPHWFLFHWVHMDTTLVVAADFVAAGKHPAAPPHQPAGDSAHACAFR